MYVCVAKISGQKSIACRSYDVNRKKRKIMEAGILVIDEQTDRRPIS